MHNTHVCALQINRIEVSVRDYIKKTCNKMREAGVVRSSVAVCVLVFMLTSPSRIARSQRSRASMK